MNLTQPDVKCDCRKRLCVTAAAYEEADMPEANKPTQTHAALRMLHDGGSVTYILRPGPPFLRKPDPWEYASCSTGSFLRRRDEDCAAYSARFGNPNRDRPIEPPIPDKRPVRELPELGLWKAKLS
jgi:hypothetical protein